MGCRVVSFLNYAERTSPRPVEGNCSAARVICRISMLIPVLIGVTVSEIIPSMRLFAYPARRFERRAAISTAQTFGDVRIHYAWCGNDAGNGLLWVLDVPASCRLHRQ
jgi:hypothetical protein